MAGRKFYALILCLLAAVIFSGGCGGSKSNLGPLPDITPSQDVTPTPSPTPIVSPDPAPSSYTVSFNTNGGSTVASQTVSSGGTVERPENPTREGYVFAGWFKDSGFTQSFTFGADGDKITGNATLYAQWLDADLLVAEYAAGEIVIGYADGDNPKYVTQNLTLPIKTGSSDILWSSSSGAVSANGNVTRQTDDVDVTLTATASYNGKSAESKTFTVKVIRKRTRDNSSIIAVPIEEASSGDISVMRNESGDVTDIEGQYVSFDIRNADDAIDAVTVLREELGIRSPDQELQTFLATSDSYGAEYSFQQIYKGVKVFGRSLMVSTNSENKGDFLHSSVLASDILNSADMKINITASQAEELAKSAYSGDVESDSERTELVVYSLEDYENKPVYAYIVRMYGTSGGENVDDNVFLNAGTGQIIQKFTNIHNVSYQTVWQHGFDELSQDVQFPTTEYPVDDGQTYLLMCDTTGLIAPVMVFSGDSTGWPIKHLPNEEWNDRHQISAYSNMREIMQWWKASFDRDSIDDKGKTVKVITHQTMCIEDGYKYDNAY